MVAAAGNAEPQAGGTTADPFVTCHSLASRDDRTSCDGVERTGSGVVMVIGMRDVALKDGQDFGGSDFAATNSVAVAPGTTHPRSDNGLTMPGPP